MPIAWSPVHKLILAGVVEKFGGKGYRPKGREKARQALDRCDSVISRVTGADNLVTNEAVEPPNDLFSIVEGHESIKEMFRLSLASKEPAHILLVSPPSSGKSLLLMELERLGERFIDATCKHLSTNGTGVLVLPWKLTTERLMWFARHLLERGPYPHKLYTFRSGVCDPDLLCGCLIVIRKELIDEVFEEDHIHPAVPLYGEDAVPSGQFY